MAQITPPQQIRVPMALIAVEQTDLGAGRRNPIGRLQRESYIGCCGRGVVPQDRMRTIEMRDRHIGITILIVIAGCQPTSEPPSAKVLTTRGRHVLEPAGTVIPEERWLHFIGMVVLPQHVPIGDQQIVGAVAIDVQ